MQDLNIPDVINILGSSAAQNIQIHKYLVDLHSEAKKATKAYVSFADETAMLKVGVNLQSIRLYRYLYELSSTNHVPSTAKLAEEFDCTPRHISALKKTLVDTLYLYEHKVTTRQTKTVVCVLGLNNVKIFRVRLAILNYCEENNIKPEDNKSVLQQDIVFYLSTHPLTSMYQ